MYNFIWYEIIHSSGIMLVTENTETIQEKNLWHLIVHCLDLSHILSYSVLDFEGTLQI